MTEEDFPALYQDANGTANRIQRSFLLASKTVIFGSLITGFLGIFDSTAAGVTLQIISAALVLVAACYLLFGKPQKVWYSTRALAESIKTISWRFVTRAEPFKGDDEAAQTQFAGSVAQLLRANDEATSLRYASAHTDLISAAMRALRMAPLEERRQRYLQDRIEDQLGWYRRKAHWNDVRSKFWYGSLILFSLTALGLSLTKLSVGKGLPVDWLFSLPIAILGWIQIKRYQELASSYSLTAHEITFAKSEYLQAIAEEKFAEFVADAENAFSREHTQWYARKDLG
jgi:hypothetical protein